MSDSWWERAACKGMPHYLFEPVGRWDPLAKKLNEDERMELNERNFRHAEEICIECPVFFQCKEDATPEDLWHTVRAGEWPGIFAKRWEHWKSSKDKGDRVCARGHTVPGGGRCMECKLMANSARRRKAKSDTL